MARAPSISWWGCLCQTGWQYLENFLRYILRHKRRQFNAAVSAVEDVAELISRSFRRTKNWKILRWNWQKAPKPVYFCLLRSFSLWKKEKEREKKQICMHNIENLECIDRKQGPPNPVCEDLCQISVKERKNRIWFADLQEEHPKLHKQDWWLFMLWTHPPKIKRQSVHSMKEHFSTGGQKIAMTGSGALLPLRMNFVAIQQ